MLSIIISLFLAIAAREGKRGVYGFFSSIKAKWRFVCQVYAYMFLCGLALFMLENESEFVQSGKSFEYANHYLMFIALALLFGAAIQVCVAARELSTIMYSTMLEFILVYFLGSGVMYTYGNQMISMIQDIDANAFLVALASVVIAYYAVKLVGLLDCRSGGRHAATMVDAHNTLLRDDDFESVCQHEVGHVMAMAMIRRALPEKVRLVVIPDGSSPRGLGYIENAAPENAPRSKEYHEYLMLMYMAGLVSDQMDGQAILGSSSDLQKWTEVFVSYANSGFVEGYHVLDPSLDEAHKKALVSQNIDRMNVLKVNQISLLWKFFERNADIRNEMLKKVRADHRLERNEIKDYLDEVDLEGMPTIKFAG